MECSALEKRQGQAQLSKVERYLEAVVGDVDNPQGRRSHVHHCFGPNIRAPVGIRGVELHYGAQHEAHSGYAVTCQASTFATFDRL